MQALESAQSGGCPPEGGFQTDAYPQPSFGYGYGHGMMGGMGAGMGAMQGFGPPSGAGACARSSASSCGCNGNVSSSAPTSPGGAPLASFDFMSGQAGGGFANPFADAYAKLAGAGAGFSPWRAGAAQPSYASGASPLQSMGSMGGMHSMGGMGAMHSMAAPGPFGLPFDPMSMNTMAGHSMPGHDMGSMPAYWALDGIGMVHAKDQIRAGQYMSDPTFFDRVAAGQYGQFSGVALNMDASGDLDGQVYISGHPAAFHQLYDQGRDKGLTGEELNQYIAEELTNVNDLDDIEERYYRYWEARGVPRPTRDHDLHNTGSIAVTLAPGQTMSLTGAHQFDTLTDPKYNFTDVKSDGRGTFIEFYRLSNNNNSGNGHHEDVAAAARIYLTPAEIGRLAGGTRPIDIVNERFRVNDNTDDYRISPAAIRRLAMMGMPIY